MPTKDQTTKSIAVLDFHFCRPVYEATIVVKQTGYLRCLWLVNYVCIVISSGQSCGTDQI